MKKALAIILCIVMMLSMVACGGNQDNSGNQNDNQNNNLNNTSGENTAESSGEPTDEEMEALRQYHIAIEALNLYAESGDLYDIYFEYDDFNIESDEDGIVGRDALAAYYDLLTNLEEIDKWVGTEWASDENINWDRQAVLDSFTVIENVLLKETHTYADHLGNKNTISWDAEWTYNVDGTVDSYTNHYFDFSGFHPWYNRSFTEQIESNPGAVVFGNVLHCVYDADGNTTKIEHMDSDVIKATRTFTRDAGVLTGEQSLEVNGNEGSVTYSYDSNNRIVKMEYIGGDSDRPSKYTYTYEYDDQGNVISEKTTYLLKDYWEDKYNLQNETVITYTYSNGYLSSGVCVFAEPWDSLGVHGTAETTDEWTYTCDEQGRPVGVSITCGDKKLKETGEVVRENDYPTCEVKIEYGDYLIYNPAE